MQTHGLEQRKSMKSVKWKFVKGYGQLYRVSDKGDIQHKDWLGNWQNHFKVINKNGYAYTMLSKNKKKTTFKVARLVAQAWIPNPKNKRTVNHKNFNRLDDSVSNLEWMTHQENSRHAFKKEGRKMPNRFGENHWNHRLTWLIINRTRKAFLKNYKRVGYQKELAAKIGVTYNYTNSILCNRVWFDPEYKSPARRLK